MHASTLGAAAPAVVITLDLHACDAPGDIDRAAEWLQGAGVAATMFVPSAMFAESRYVGPLRGLERLGHEVGSHAHHHDWPEISALMDGSAARLGFLRKSRDMYRDFYGRTPLCFRSPAWCPLGRAARDELHALGYRVDSSATPQRPGFLGSFPFRPGWMFSLRRVHFLRPGLLEIPTSTLLVPAGSPTFRTLRRRFTLGMLRLLLAEARALGSRAVVAQFHPEDFNPHGTLVRPTRRMQPADFLPMARGGFEFRAFLRDNDSARVNATARASVGLLARRGSVPLMVAAEQFWPGAGAERAAEPASGGAGSPIHLPVGASAAE